MKKKNKGGHNQSASARGDGGGAQKGSALSADHVRMLSTLADRMQAKSDRKQKRELAREVAQLIGRGHKPSRKPKKKSSTVDVDSSSSEDSESTSSSDSSDDYSSTGKLKKKSHKEKTAVVKETDGSRKTTKSERMKKKLKEAEENNKKTTAELEHLKSFLYTRIESAASPESSQGEKQIALSAKLLKDAEDKAKVVANSPKKPGLFDLYFLPPPPDIPTQVTENLRIILVGLEDKYPLENGDGDFLADEVIMKMIKTKAKEVAKRYYTTADARKALHQMVQATDLRTQAMNPEPLVTAILRAAFTRKVDITAEQLCLT